MVRNSTKRAAASASTPVAARLSPATATTPSPMAATTATTTRGRQPPRTSTSSAVTDPSTSPRPQRTTRASASSSTPAAVVPVEAQAPVIQLKDENDGSKSFTCSTCQVKVKLDANRSPSEHTCETKPEIRLRKRLRGPPPYQYSNEEAAVALPPIKKRGKKAAFVSLHEKKAVDAEKEAWLQREVLNKVYDPKDIWCRYCGCVQASGFSRGPWGSRKLCTIHYVQWQTKKTLDLSKWPKEPVEPINRLENTEFDYLRRMQAKGVKFEDS